MERARQAEMKRQFQTVAKAALVNNIKVDNFCKATIQKNIFRSLGIKKT